MSLKPLSLDQIWDVVKRITYKPGWRILIDPSPLSDRWMFVVRGAVRDVDSGIPTTVTFQRDTELEFYSNEEVVQVVRSIISDLEQHEIKEWLKVDGKCFQEPHPELRGNI